MNNYPQAKQVVGYGEKSLATIHDPTVEENIDAKIAIYKKEIESLEAAKERIPAALRGLKISDLRNAMNY